MGSFCYVLTLTLLQLFRFFRARPTSLNLALKMHLKHLKTDNRNISVDFFSSFLLECIIKHHSTKNYILIHKLSKAN